MDAFTHFLELHASDLKRIARATRGEHPYEDVVHEAWLMAAEISARLERPVDFHDGDFRDLLLRHLYQALVRYTELNVRHAVRLDHAPGNDAGDDGAHWLMNRLVSDQGQDPFSRLLDAEDGAEAKDAAAARHSLAGAWVALLGRHDDRMQAVARTLLVSSSHAYRCFAGALSLARAQASIPFGGSGPPTQLGPWRRSRAIRIPRQLELDFREELPLRQHTEGPVRHRDGCLSLMP
jgi:hypothetical protein